ncbi:M20/M25/M40 family metallo-hydrolase [Streptococcus dentapri]|uniref:M20/M25/M40 family metallo-hydrolase n=1 Tax=Streptococcus dentapri TaxID=573564 RepID=A0ABV8D3I2_9STRE
MDLYEYGQKIYELLHQTPELSSQEVKTREIISRIVNDIGGYEIIYEGKEGLIYGNVLEENNRCRTYDLGFRAELDALCLPNGNIFHGCGHDLHMSSLLQFMAYLSRRETSKRILFIYQSSEEIGNGGLTLVNILKRKNILIDKMFSLHNAPEIPVESIAIKSGETLTNNVTNKLRISFYEKDRNSDNIQKFLSVWDILYAKIVAFNNNNKNINMSIGEFTVNSQIGSQATNLTFSLSLRSNLNDIFALEKLFKQFLNELNRVNVVKSIEVQNLNFHWRIQNSHSLYQKLKNNSMFLTLEIPDDFTSDDFCYYDQVSNDVFYLFLGSYLKFKTSRTHTSDYKPNLKFINSSLKLYKYILEEC